MTLTHEMGHIVAGWACGGTLKSADLRPWHLPYSIFDPDPHPIVTLWGGPVFGAVLPVGMAMLLRRAWLFVIAYFCILANGTYLATAWVGGDRFLDTPQLLGHGAHFATVAVYCLLTIGAGYIGFRRHCIRMLWPTLGEAVLQTKADASTSKAVDEPAHAREAAAALGMRSESHAPPA